MMSTRELSGKPGQAPFISSPKDVERLRRQLPGIRCVEMEGAAVAQVCSERPTPFVVIRVISDNADHAASFDFLEFIDDFADHYIGGIVQMLWEEHSQ